MSRQASTYRVLSPEESRRFMWKAFQRGIGRGLHEYVTARLPIALYRRVDSFAASHSVKRSEAVRRLIERGLGAAS